MNDKEIDFVERSEESIAFGRKRYSLSGEPASLCDILTAMRLGKASPKRMSGRAEKRGSVSDRFFPVLRKVGHCIDLFGARPGDVFNGATGRVIGRYLFMDAFMRSPECVLVIRQER